jgi:hypothetical protein
VGAIVSAMASDEPTVEQLKQRQLDQERAERECLADADTEADADRHRRRADKAHYLHSKLVQRDQADRDAAAEDS